MQQEYKRREIDHDEIDLMDYIKIIIKRKCFIFTVFLVLVLLAGLFSYFLPKIYKIDTVLELGRFEGGIIGEPNRLEEKLKTELYKLPVVEELDIAESEYPKIKITSIKDTRLITLETESKDPQKTLLVLEEINRLILAEHEELLEEKKGVVEAKVSEIQEGLDLLKTQKIYADQGIAYLQINLVELKEKLNSAKDTRVIRPPTSSDSPIRPRTSVNVSIAGVLGLFMGTFLAFGKEWWEEAKKRQ